ncbi:MAG: cupredoxin domain-containing protein [Dehalococcoidia bacterium]
MVYTNKKIFLAGLVLGLFFVAGCTRDEKTSATAPLPEAVAEATRVAATAPIPEAVAEATPVAATTPLPEAVAEATPVAETVDGVKVIRVRAREFSFDVTSITVNKGDRVKIIFENAGTIVHDVGIDGYGRTEIILGGLTDTIEFVAEKSGTFDMWCSVEGHRPAGMEGEFIVN